MSRTIRICPRTYEKVQDGKAEHPIYGCGCEICERRAGVTKGDYKERYQKIKENIADRELKTGVIEFENRYDDCPALDHWLDNNFPTYEEEVNWREYQKQAA